MTPPVRRLAAVAVLATIVGLAWLRTRPERPFRVDGATMGTTYSVTVAEGLSREAQDSVRDAVAAGLARIEALMSTYDPASELSRLNAYRGTEPLRVSDDLIDVLTAALGVAERSGGAFDPTVGPLVDAWGFGPDVPEWTVPSDAVLAERRRVVGYGLVTVDRAAGTATKRMPGTSIDLSGVAKGYAAGRVAAELAAMGHPDVLVDVGGELQALGTRGGRPWRVGIESPPLYGRAGIAGTVELADEAVATSGDYRNYVEEGGVLYAHIVDPRTGRALPVRGFSVSVIDADGAVADAWATALVVLGPDEGFEVAEREGVQAIFSYLDGADVAVRITSAAGRRPEAGGAR